MLDRQATRDGERRRIPRLQPVTADAVDAGWVGGPVARDVHPRPVRKVRRRHTEEDERRLVAEELSGRQARGTLEAALHESERRNTQRPESAIEGTQVPPGHTPATRYGRHRTRHLATRSNT